MSSPGSIVEAFDELPALDASWRELVASWPAITSAALGEVALAALPPQLRDLDRTQLMRRPRNRRGIPAGAAECWHGGNDIAIATGNIRCFTPQQEAVVAGIDAVARLQPVPHAAIWLHRQRQDRGTCAPSSRCCRGDPLAQVLVLVPEINLTPATEQRFAQSFPLQRRLRCKAGMTPAQRLHGWLAAHTGEARIVLARAWRCWCPLARLRLIVVDEEHDPSWAAGRRALFGARSGHFYRARKMQAAKLLVRLRCR